MGPSLTQTLSDARDEITYTLADGSMKSLVGSADAPLSVKSNYLCQSSAGTIDVEALLKQYESDSSTEIPQFRLSCSNVDEVKCAVGDATEALTIGNFGSN